ncbi:MAG: xanthine dehydrogenase family protein molybdopterin-binding subunit, partial [Sphingomonas sp.]
MTAAPFEDRARFDARDKVLGVTQFVADIAQANVLYAMLVPARIAKGRLTALSTEAALRVPGVVRVLTAADFSPPAPPPEGAKGAAAAPPPPTIKQEIGWRGEPVALVLADTLEAAIEGAEAVDATYEPVPFSCLITSAGAKREASEPVTAGNAARAMARAATTIEVEYGTPPQHHNPIEMLSTTAVWSGGRLTVYESSQAAGLVKAKICEALRLRLDQVEVISSYLGGGFGQKGAVQRQTALVARAAMLTGRPVK